jgi:hypothetical protein
MADEPKPAAPGHGPPSDEAAAAAPEPSADEGSAPHAEERERAERGLTDFVRRAVSAGMGAATRSKDDIMRAAAGEMRSWLEHLNLNEELAKALSKLVIEVKTEVRFRPNEEGKIVSETSNDVKVKTGPGR